MACGCNKSNQFSQATPFKMGDLLGDWSVARQMTASVSLMGIRSGQTFWGIGDGWESMMENRWVKLL